MDLVTLGEGLIRLSLPNHRKVDLAAHVGGAELNVAVAVARLRGGMAARWVSRLPDNAPGRFIEGSARVQGVDARVQWSTEGEGRVGLYYLEQGSAPRQSSVVYDRAGSAFSRVSPGTIDWSLQLRGARWF